MSKVIIKNLILVVAVIFITSIPSISFGAQLSFELVPNGVGDEQITTIEVKIDPQGKTLNVVEGVIVFEGKTNDRLSVEVETGGSVLTIWPTQPQYLSKEKAIRFTGGVPGGFNRNGLLFRLRLFSPVSGEIKINWVNGAAYLNDGKGTKDPIFARSMKVNLVAQSIEVSNKFSTDIRPPSFDAVEISRDDSVYDGKYFISFNAKDDVSGVDKYEVKEGQSVTTVTDGVYVLKDQTRKTPVVIIAYDKAGNNAIIKVPVKINWLKYVIIILIAGVLLFLILYVYKKTKK